MIPGIFTIQFSNAYHFLYIRMVSCDLTDLAAHHIESAVTHIGHLQKSAHAGCRHYGRTHSFQLLILTGTLPDHRISFLDRLAEDQ